LRLAHSAIVHSTATARPALALPEKPSIAVLPFTNLSGDPQQDYFADGIVEEITTALSRFHWLFVIARNSSFLFKGMPISNVEVHAGHCPRPNLRGFSRCSPTDSANAAFEITALRHVPLGSSQWKLSQSPVLLKGAAMAAIGTNAKSSIAISRSP
jgi:hypothetical protein